MKTQHIYLWQCRVHIDTGCKEAMFSVDTLCIVVTKQRHDKNQAIKANSGSWLIQNVIVVVNLCGNHYKIDVFFPFHTMNKFLSCSDRSVQV